MKKKNESKPGLNRRELLFWSAPVITMVALPAHAQMSQPRACAGPPILNVVAQPKCSGDPPIGTAVIEILGPDEFDMELKDIQFTTTDSKSSLSSLPTLPVIITDISGVTFTWLGPATDGVTCLPLASIEVTIDYCCEDGQILTETYDLTQLLIDSIP